MSVTDELAKIEQAEEWLRTEPPGSELYAVGRDHLLSLASGWGPTEQLRAAAREALGRHDITRKAKSESPGEGQG
jgi:hypothetical protein